MGSSKGGIGEGAGECMCASGLLFREREERECDRLCEEEGLELD